MEVACGLEQMMLGCSSSAPTSSSHKNAWPGAGRKGHESMTPENRKCELDDLRSVNLFLSLCTALAGQLGRTEQHACTTSAWRSGLTLTYHIPAALHGAGRLAGHQGWKFGRDTRVPPLAGALETSQRPNLDASSGHYPPFSRLIKILICFGSIEQLLIRSTCAAICIGLECKSGLTLPGPRRYDEVRGPSAWPQRPLAARGGCASRDRLGECRNAVSCRNDAREGRH